MRVSPALLACCSLVAIAGLPSQAAESSEAASTSNISHTDEATLHLAQAAPASEGTRLEPMVEQHLEPTVSLSRLLQGASKQPPATALEPVQTAQAESSPVGNPVLPVPPADRQIERRQEPDIEIQIDDTDEDSGIEANDDDSTDDVLLDDPLNPDVNEGPIDDELEEEFGDEINPDDGEVDIQIEQPPTPSVPNNAIPVPDSDTPNQAPNQAPGQAPDTEESEAPAETRVLVSEVDVVSSNERPLTDELIDAVYRSVGTVPGRTTTRTQLQTDINSIFSTGFFSNVRAEPEDTPLGVKVTYFVEPNPVLTNVDVRNRQVLTDETIDEIFGDQYNETLNLRNFQDAVLDLNDWYQENGYVLAQVTAAPQISEDGEVTLIVAEGEIESIEVRFIDPDGNTTDEDGDPIGGKTRDFIVTREFETEPGDVFREQDIQRDVGNAFGLGIFEDIRLSFDPGDEDPRKVKLIVSVAERDTGSIGASLGFNLRGDLFGQLSYNEDNFGGNNQKLRTEGRVTTRGDFLFDIGFTDPWIAGDPYRTSYTTSLFNRRSTSLIFDGGDTEIDLPDPDNPDDLDAGDTPRINRLGTGISFSRPLDNGLSLSLGTQYERVAVLDSDGDVNAVDAAGNPLTASSSGRDDLFTVQFGAVLDRRNNALAPTSGSLLRLGTEQSVPVGSGSIFYNKLTASYSQYVPVNFFNSDRGETLAFNLQGGTAIGEIPPYEAFPLGGGNSVRGFEEGEVGAGTSFVLATAEYRFPLFTEFLNGALFADYGTDLGTGDNVPGDPAGDRGKDGSGFGYGAGVRVQTPLGALRLDYGLSEEGSRFHFGFGERF